MHTPGLRLAMPATVQDAYHLLRQSLTKPDPVVFIEHKALYTRKEEVDLTAEPLPWGKAAVRREGGDLVIVTYSDSDLCAGSGGKAGGQGHRGHCHRSAHAEPAGFRHRSAARRTRRQGDGGERRRDDVGRCGRACGAHFRRMFDFLEQPVVRVAGEDIPISVSQELESGSVPSTSLLSEVAEKMLS